MMTSGNSTLTIDPNVCESTASSASAARAPFYVLFGLLYGAIVASAYLFAKSKGQNGGLTLFGLSSAVIFIGHLLLWPRLTLAGFTDRKMIFRGLLYGLTQVLIFKAQAQGNTSIALTASTMGSIFGIILGRMILQERVEGIAIISVFLCFAAVGANPTIVLKSHWGVVGGLIQGLGFVLARSLMLDKKSRRQSISTGFCLAAIVSFGALILGGGLPYSFTDIQVKNVIGVIVLALVIQYSFFYLYKVLDSQRASMLSLSRIPWALSAEHFVLGSLVLMNQVFSSALIAIGSILLLWESSHLRQKRANP